ncbi:hypothetical protein O3G_MSEX013396 [Manduca sexta]|uniref:Uncharacterized protein n=1 Tax=Manduca sexta TaxID=7130 RepID=A0A922CZ80_MANSE|nr:hypothetical protein O3G_MSEX013396 [Manduca sexta]
MCHPSDHTIHRKMWNFTKSVKFMMLHRLLLGLYYEVSQSTCIKFIVIIYCVTLCGTQIIINLDDIPLLNFSLEFYLHDVIGAYHLIFNTAKNIIYKEKHFFKFFSQLQSFGNMQDNQPNCLIPLTYTAIVFVIYVFFLLTINTMGRTWKILLDMIWYLATFADYYTTIIITQSLYTTMRLLRMNLDKDLKDNSAVEVKIDAINKLVTDYRNVQNSFESGRSYIKITVCNYVCHLNKST